MLDKVASLIRQTAQECLLPHFNNLQAGEVAIKSSPTDFVTIADTEAETFLAARLRELEPESIVVGEEVAFKNPNVFDALSCPDTVIWIIDPLDGTKNFIKGKDVFGIIVAMVKNGKTVAGWIHIPLHDDMMIMGEQGGGVWANGSRLPMIGGHKKPEELKGTLSIELPALDEKIKNKLWWGSAAFSYAMLATGVVDFGIYSTHPLQPWDHAAGVFLHKELGGYSAMLDGSEYRPVQIDGSLILASDFDTWKMMAKAMESYMA